MHSPALLLASNSPRRRQLLALTGWEFEVNPAEIDETPHQGESPSVYVRRLAQGKAQAAARRGPPGLVLAADTIVADGQDLFGKPVDAADARRMLARLAGRTHQVYTAICLLDPSSGKQAVDLCTSHVPMRAYSPAEVEAYVASGDPLDKAGAYAIQHPAFHPVQGFAGCQASVMGLPLCHLARTAAAFGITPRRDLPSACQAALGYTCPVFAAILAGENAG